jgi:hypothetical protein
LYVKTHEPSRAVGGIESFSGRGLETRSAFRLPSGDAPATGSTLAVFSLGRRELIAAACGDALCLVDSASFASGDVAQASTEPKPVLSRVQVASSAGNYGLGGQLATWQDQDGTRWILASVVGPPRTELRGLAAGEVPKEGFIAAFTVREKDGQPALTLAWISRGMNSPQPPVIVNGVVFALSAGIDDRMKKGTHATLYALDARTGKELYSSRDLITVPASLTGLTVATGRVYFGGLDGVFHAFGMSMEH